MNTPDDGQPVCVPVLSNKHEGLEAIIDARDLPLVRAHRLHLSPGKGHKEVTGGALYLMIDGSPKTLARLILGVIDPKQLVCHANGDKFDCRRTNLVIRTRSEVAKAKKPSPQTIARLTPYPDPERPGVWHVPLKGYLEYREALIDEADLPVVRGRNWNWSPRHGEGNGRMDGVVVRAGIGKRAPLHRLIMNVTDPKTRVTFINGDALDCRRANLEVLTLAEIAQRSRAMAVRAGSACTSAFKGISRDSSRGKWLAVIRKGRVSVHLGRFDDEVEAAKAYDAAARVLFNGRGFLNLPDATSTERALADARVAVDEALTRTRQQRRRQRDIERELRRAAADMVDDERETPEPTGPLLPAETVRHLFDITPSVWRRWQRFGWLPPAGAAAAGNGEATYSLSAIERLLRRCNIVALPYPDPQRPGVYRVPLSPETAQGREALIDADAVPLVRTTRWLFAASDSGRGGEVRSVIPSDKLSLHYVVMGIAGDKGIHLGHRNDDPLDCRRENLVVRTLSDTHANHRKQATICGQPCTSRFKGVCRPRRSKSWLATITKDRVQRRIGAFRDEIAAAQAYDEAARELFGEHALVNFPDGVDAWLEAEASRRTAAGDKPRAEAA